MGVYLGDRGITARDRVKARTAVVVDSAIDRTRLRVGRVLSRVQTRCRKVHYDLAPAEDPAEVAYHRRMMMVDTLSPPAAVMDHLAEVRRQREAVSA